MVTFAKGKPRLKIGCNFVPELSLKVAGYFASPQGFALLFSLNGITTKAGTRPKAL